MRRFIRVVPLYWVATAAFIIVKYICWRDLPTLSQVIRSLMLFPLFGSGPNNLPLYFPAWTLQYEMLFYIIFTIALLISRNYAKSVVFLVLLFLSAVTLPIFWADGNEYFQSSMCLEFAYGIVIYALIAGKLKIPPSLGVMAVVLSVLVFSLNYRLGSTSRALSWGLPAALLVGGMLAFEGSKWLRYKVFVTLGDASYAIYLSHISLQIFIGEAAKWYRVDLDSSPLLKIAILFTSSILVGVLSHFVIEKPMLKLLRRSLPRKQEN